MNESEFTRIYEECEGFRARICASTDMTPESVLYVATCLLMQVQLIHREVGGPTLDAALLYHAADKSAGLVKGK